MGNPLHGAIGEERHTPVKSPPQRVALISPYAPSIVSFRGALIRDLIQAGAEVVALAPDYTTEIRTAVANLGAVPGGYPLNRAEIDALADLRTFVSLWRILRRLRPDVIIPYNIKPVVYGTLAGALAGIPTRIALIEGLGYAFIDDEHESFKKNLLRRIVKSMYKIALKKAHKVLFLNPDDQNEFIQNGIVPANKAVLLGGIGVDLREWSPSPPVLEPVTFTLAARLLREKGIIEFVESAKQIRQCHPHTRFLLLGGIDTNPGALKPEEVQQWVEEGIIEWHGHVSDVRPYFALTSVYVLPSYREGVSRSTQEAMAMARPVITTDAPGCRETVVHGENGLLVPPRDIGALVEAMEYFIKNPQEIVRMGEASRRLAEERFDVRKINRKLIEVIGLEAP